MQQRKLIALDTETFLISAGNPCPRVVCFSYAGEDGVPGLMLRDEGIAFMHMLLDEDWDIVGQNVRFDLCCLCNHDGSLFPKIVQALEEGRIHDIGIRDMLFYLSTQGLFSEAELQASGQLGKRKVLNFALDDMVKRRFRVNISEAKSKTKSKLSRTGEETQTVVGDKTAWRLRYSELDGVPLDQWPEEARKYAAEDAMWTMRIFKNQGPPDGIVNADMQAISSFWLNLMSIYGVRTDPDYVIALDSRLQKEFRVQNALLAEAGLVKLKKVPSKDQAQKGEWVYARDMRQLRRRVALAYGGERALHDLESIFRNQDLQRTLKQDRAKALKKHLSALKKAGLPLDTPFPEPASVAPHDLDAEDDSDGEDTGVVKVVNGVPMTDKGQIATDRDTLQKLVHPKALEQAKEAFLADVSDDIDVKVPSIHPYCDAVADIYGLDKGVFYNELILHEVGERSGVEKLLGTFVPVLLQGTRVPINPRWNTLVATGRTSASRPNLQQLPRKGGVRECFIPRPGHWFIGADYSFVELCTLAEFCYWKFGFSKLGDAINAGMDPHLLFASNLMGITYQEAEALQAAGDETIAEMRQASKCADFGYPGGLGAESFREYAKATYGVVLTAQRAAELKIMFYQLWPEVKLYHRYISSLSNTSHEFAITQLYSNRVRAGCVYTAGANSFFQGLAADGAKLAGWMLMREMYLPEPYKITRPERLLPFVKMAVDVLHVPGPSPLYGSRTTVFAHDEFIAESEQEKAPEAADRMSKVMVECMQIYTPHVKIRSEAVIMRRWLKGAKPVRDASGRLQPWEPKKKK